MLTVYQQLMRLYPAEHRKQFGDEMLSVLCDVRTDNANKNMLRRTIFCAREVAGLILGATRENLHALLGTQAGIRFTTRRCVMRNGFRFPKTTILFMGLILASVISAIKKGEAIALSAPNLDPPLPFHTQPVHSVLLGGIPLFLAFFYAAGLIGWAILFALRRSGVHRLDNMSAGK